MISVCKENACTGCRACVEICGRNAISIKEKEDAYNAIINPNLCIGCNQCNLVCQINNPVHLQKPINCAQGWSNNLDDRLASASGGFAYEIEKTFLNNGGHVWSCAFDEGDFVFLEANSDNDLSLFRGSKYVKSNMRNAFKKIKLQLTSEKVLFVGLPCQVAALKNYIGEATNKNLYTVDLICHGTPSPILLEKFLSQYKCSLEDIKEIYFRTKESNTIITNQKRFAYKGTMDCYTMAFLEGLIYTQNCYECKYAAINRISDLTIGDSWGSELSINEKIKGISLALIMSEKGEELLQNPNLTLLPVDFEKAKQNNKQLYQSANMNINRIKFFKMLNAGKTFNFCVANSLKKIWLRQHIKAVLIFLKLKKPEEKIYFNIVIKEKNKG